VNDDEVSVVSCPLCDADGVVTKAQAADFAALASRASVADRLAVAAEEVLAAKYEDDDYFARDALREALALRPDPVQVQIPIVEWVLRDASANAVLRWRLPAGAQFKLDVPTFQLPPGTYVLQRSDDPSGDIEVRLP